MILWGRSSGRNLLGGSPLIHVVSAEVAGAGRPTFKMDLSSLSGPLVLLGFSPSTWHLILQDLSKRYRLLLAWWSQGRWVSYVMAGFPQSIQFKPPGQKLQVLYWLDLRNPLTSLLSHPVILSSKSLKLAKIQGERKYLSVGGVAKNLQLTLI